MIKGSNCSPLFCLVDLVGIEPTNPYYGYGVNRLKRPIVRVDPFRSIAVICTHALFDRDCPLAHHHCDFSSDKAFGRLTGFLNVRHPCGVFP